MILFKLKHLVLLVYLCTYVSLPAQILPESRSTNWENAGLTAVPNINPAQVDILSVGGDNTGVNDNDEAFETALNHASLVNGGTIYFPEGTYRFRATMKVYNRNGIVIKGAGSDKTFFKFYAQQYTSTWQWDAIHFRGQLQGPAKLLEVNPEVGSNSITLEDASPFSPGEYIKLFQEDYSGPKCSGNKIVNGNGDINNCYARHSIAHFSKIISKNGNTLILDNPIRYAYETAWSARVRKFKPILNVGVESLSLEFIGLHINQFQPKNIYYQFTAESWIKDVESYNTGFGHFVVASSTNIEIRNCSGHHDFFGSQGGGRGYGIVFEFGANYCLAENNVLYELRHPLVAQSGANANVFGYNFSNRESNFWADIVLHGNYPFLNLFEGNVGEVYRGDNSGHGVNGPYNTFFRNRATAGITEYSGSTFNQNYIGNEISGNYNINADENFVYGNTLNGTNTESLDDVSYYRNEPLLLDQECAWPQIGYPNTYSENKTMAQLRYEQVTIKAPHTDNCNLTYNFEINPLSAEGANDGSIELQMNDDSDETINVYWHKQDQVNGSIANLSAGCYSAFIYDENGCYDSETFDLFTENSENELACNIKVMLQGPYNTSLEGMNANIHSLPSFPLNSPYGNVNSIDSHIDDVNILETTGNNAIVDWILVELRDGQNPSTVIQSKPALLQSDGDVVSAIDGNSPISFNTPSSEYNTVFMAIKHRNHLAVRTSQAVLISLLETTNFDFTNENLALLGNENSTQNINGTRCLISGDANNDGSVGAIDKNSLWRIQNANPYSYESSSADFNLDGMVNPIDKNFSWRINNGSTQSLE